MAFDDINQRIKRYEKAKIERQLKINKLTQAYRMSFPTRAKWLVSGRGSESVDKTRYRWDTTAVQGLKQFASNIQSLLMPPFQQWASFKPGPKVSGAEAKILDQALQESSDVLFQAIEASNLMLEANVSFQDMGIAVGLLQICSTSDDSHPIMFKSIPMHKVALGEFNGKIEDVYREMKVPARDIPNLWPDVVLSDDIKTQLKIDPGADVDLLEGTVYYPGNPVNERYQYFVMDVKSKKDIVNRKQSMSRWIPFRFAVSPGEVWGEGPVLQVLDAIRVVNKIVEMDLLNAGFKVSRPLFVNGSQVLNPNNLKMEPGSIIHVNNTAPGQLPIVPLDIAGDFSFDQVTLEHYQSEIRDALFGDPLGPNQTPNQSATEASIRQQNWVKRSASSMGRLANELLRPIILKTCVLLQERGLMPSNFHIDPHNMDIFVNGMRVDVDFLSPLARLEDQQKAQELVQYAQELQGLMGPQLAIGALNVSNIPQYLAEKMDIDPSLVKSSAEISALVQQGMQAQQQAQQAQQMQMQNQQSAEAAQQPPQLPQLNLS